MKSNFIFNKILLSNTLFHLIINFKCSLEIKHGTQHVMFRYFFKPQYPRNLFNQPDAKGQGRRKKDTLNDGGLTSL